MANLKAHILSLTMSGDRFPADTIRDISVADYLKESSTFRHCAKGWRPANGVDFPKEFPRLGLLVDDAK